MAAEHNYEWQQQPGGSGEREATAVPAGTAITMQNVDSLRSWVPRFSRASVSDEAGASAQRILINRVGICCVAVGLLWLTTLDMSTAIADAHFKSISLNAVVTSWERSIEVVRMEEESYELCSDREIYACNQAFNTSLLELDAMLAARSDQNIVNVNEAIAIAADCSGTYREVAQSLLAYSRAGHDIPYDTAACTEAEIQEVSDMLGDASAQTDYAYSLSTDYKRSTGQLFMKAGESWYNYTEYNANYLDEKTGSLNTDINGIAALSVPGLTGIANAFAPVSAAADTFVACTLKKQCQGAQTPAADGCCADQTMAEAYDAMVVELKDLYTTAVQSYNDTKSSVAAQYAVVANMLERAVDFLEIVSPYWGSIQSSISGLSSVDFPSGISVGLPISFPFGALGALVDVPSLTTFFGGSYQNLYNNMNNTITEAGEQIEEAATGWAAGIGNITAGITLFDDYDPPEVYDPTEDFEANSDAFLASQAAALGAVYTGTTDDGFSANETLAYLVSSIVPPSPINLTVSGFSTENYSFYNFYDVLSIISFGAVFLDYSWRVFYSLQMIVRYWSTSAVGLPVVDVRQFKTTQKTPAMVIVSRILTSPYVLYTGLLFAFILGIATLLSAYLPIYYKFQNGCVKSHDGTLLSNNADSFAYNWASLSGAGNIAEGLKSYDSRRNSECAGYTNKANNDYSTFQASWNNADSARQGTAVKVAKIQKCIDTSTNGIIFKQGIYEFIIKDEDGVSYTHPQTLFDETRCNTPPPALVSLSFNCTDYLPECAVGCNGPSPLLIRYTTHQSSCASEDLIHSALLKLFTGLIIYICLNISRIAFTKGLSMVFWRSITPFGFNFVGSCSRGGKMTVNAKTLLQAETAIMIGKFRIQAAGLIIFAGLIQLPWLFMLVYIR